MKQSWPHPVPENDGARDRYIEEGVRPEMLDALILWGKEFKRPGGFLCALLENDLQGAVGRADEDNLAHLRQLCQFVWNELPGQCHGNPEKVNAWAARADAAVPA